MTAAEKSPSIAFENVSFRFSEHDEWILQDIDISIAPGEWIAIIGGNGSGKSTFVKLMNGLLKPSSGKVYVLGESIDSANLREIRQHVGIVFQNPDEQSVGVTVEEDIAFGLQNLLLSRDEMMSRIDKVLKMLQLEDLRYRPVRTLSGGQKQLVAIAGILVMHPQVIIFDEASSMLDPQSSIKLLRVITDLHRMGLTVIQVTHNPEDIWHADRILVLNKGYLSFVGDVPALMQQSDIFEETQILPPFLVRLQKTLGTKGLELNVTCGSGKEMAKSIWESISSI